MAVALGGGLFYVNAHQTPQREGWAGIKARNDDR